MKHANYFLWALILLSLLALPYVGPGAGLSMIGSFLALLAGIGIALFFVLLYPIRLLLKRRKQKKTVITPDKAAE